MPFDHEKLRVYQEAIQFIAWAEEVTLALVRKGSVADQLDRAATSVALNIAEGNGKYLKPDRCRFFEIARGSALECASCLDVMVAKRRLAPKEAAIGKQMLESIVSMLVGLIRSNSDRLREGEGESGAEVLSDSSTSTNYDHDYERDQWAS